MQSIFKAVLERFGVQTGLKDNALHPNKLKRCITYSGSRKRSWVKHSLVRKTGSVPPVGRQNVQQLRCSRHCYVIYLSQFTHCICSFVTLYALVNYYYLLLLSHVVCLLTHAKPLWRPCMGGMQGQGYNSARKSFPSWLLVDIKNIHFKITFLTFLWCDAGEMCQGKNNDVIKKSWRKILKVTFGDAARCFFASFIFKLHF